MKEQYNIDGYKNLAAAVVEKAVRDYKHALRVLKRNPNRENAIRMKEDCERFFRNDIGMYSELDGESIIRIINEKVEKEFSCLKKRFLRNM